MHILFYVFYFATLNADKDSPNIISYLILFIL